jgi:gliding motility-associated-like protein
MGSTTECMKRFLFLFPLFIAFRGFAQCGYQATLRGTTSCVGATLKVSTAHALASIVWYQGGTPVDTVIGTRQGGTLVREAGDQPTPLGQGPSPSGLFVDDNGDIYMSDYINARVMEWSPATGAWATVAGGNGPGLDANQLYAPMGIFVDRTGNIYIANGDFDVRKWTPGATTGTIVAGGNGYGSNADQLAYATSVYVDCDGNMYIVDAINNRVQRWAPGSSSGVTVAGGNGAGSAANQLTGPACVWLDGNKNMYITDAGNARVQKWAVGASSGVTVAGGNGIGNAANQLYDPVGLTVDGAGNIYIADLSNDRYQKWGPGSTSGVTIISPTISAQFAAGSSIFLDDKGTLYGGFTVGIIFQQDIPVGWQQGSTIDYTYKPATAGRYYAIVTDVAGFIASTDTFALYAPSNPSPIQISATATNVDVCTPVTFTAAPSYPPSSASYQWLVSGVDVGGDSATYSNNLFANGDRITCILTTANNSCSLVQDTSNPIVMSVDPQGHPTVTITASDTSVCAGTTITFTATVTNGSTTPAFEWLVNGVAANDTTSEFNSANLSGGNVVYCLITSDASCGLAKSNSIPVFIYPVPTIASGQIITIPYGKSEILDPIISGDVASYTWTPGAYLSDSAIRNPVADPPVTTVYTLRLGSPGGCKASGSITVDVYTPLSLPGAFTPNGDGHNDILYVLGAPANALIREFTIFDRWGASVFESHNATPGDARQGWNGTSHGHPEPAGTYVYIVLLALPNGTQKMYKGTVILIR